MAAREVRQLKDMDGIDAMIIPGGESTTMGKLLNEWHMLEPLRERIMQGMPVYGSCAGLILLARRVLDPAPGQRSLGVLDVTVRRNAFGPQVDSTEAELDTSYGPARVAFIRAPQVTETGPGVEVLARRGDGIVGVRQGTITGVAFHPELTDEPLFHRRLLSDALASR